MNPWLETGAVLLIVGAALFWAVRRFLRARREAASASPCASCSQAGTCQEDQNRAVTTSAEEPSKESSCPKP